MTHRALAPGSASTGEPIPVYLPKVGLSAGQTPSYAEPSRSRLGAGTEALRRVLTIILTIGLLATPLVADAQSAGKRVPRIGYLDGGSLSPNSVRIEAFRQGLRELGYVEGQNIAIEWRSAEGKADRLPGLAAELVR